jgi:hypothetical protein
VGIVFPPKTIIDHITDWCVIWFKDKEFSPEARPHYYIVVPTAIGNLIVCIVTSQVEKLNHNYYGSAITALVPISATDFDFIVKPSVINCNKAEMLSRQELLDKFVPGTFKKLHSPVKDDVKAKILAAINVSPLVKPVIRKALN